MELRNCMNRHCNGTTSSDGKRGWSLNSGGFATLCYRCGCAFENSVFCETFHLEETGWRECEMCRKPIHCGCVASSSLREDMDFGGVGCISCIKRFGNQTFQPFQVPTNGSRDARTRENRIDDGSTKKLMQLTKCIGTNNASSSIEQLIDLTQECSPPTFLNMKPNEADNETPNQPSPIFSLTTPLSNPNEAGEQNKSTNEQKTCSILPIPPNTTPETSKGGGSQAHRGRPPTDEVGRNQLNPRYWPTITDEELQRLSEDLNLNIKPLFQKELSASDAGRVGRLILPKQCAEKFFPKINHSEGIPLRVQDIEGQEWTFQFRFWPNNNSRMYVLEGVSHCMQVLQAQAGDTVLFSRIEPGGQLVITCQKATNNDDMQDSQTVTTASGDSHGDVANLPSNGDEQKKSKNMKNKRLHTDNDGVVELKVTWGEAQELLHPSPTAESTVVMVEGFEFEEFDEPPVIGTRTFLTSGSSPEDVCHKDLGSAASKESYSKNKGGSNEELAEEVEPSGLDALANAALLGDSMNDVAADSSVGATTRHPRHRPGCTCIVCIQPPSGKGKHMATCKCSVCLTVKRRFKTLMTRKKKRQSEREAEMMAQAKETNETKEVDVGESSSKMGWDLNAEPQLDEEDILDEVAGMSLTSLMNDATLPSKIYGTPMFANQGCTSGRKDGASGHP